MVRSNSPSHSSRSRSGSHSSSRSRTRSRSRKKRYSSRSRSRSYSRSRSRERERNYPRDYRRDYRMNRGMRRPYGFRGRGRGYYHQGGGRFQHRGGFRPNWQNRRYSRSPRRGRSRSRTPKRRSASQRSRSKSHHSERSSLSRRSSSSRSSSRCSRSPVPSKKRSSQDKPGKKLEGGPTKDEGAGRQPEEEKGDAKSEQAANASSKSLSDLKRAPAVITESWVGIAAYNDTSPRSHRSPTPTHPSQSSLRSDTVSRQVTSKISPPSLPSQRLHSLQHSPDGLLGHYSPSHDSPLYCTSPRRSPAKAFSASQSGRAFFPNSDEQNLPKAGKYLKRYTEEEGSRVYLHERGNGREKDAQKDRIQEKGRAERDGEWAEQGGLDLGGKKEGEKVPFLGDSPEVEEEDESQAYRQPYQFKVTSQVDQVKSYAVESRWNLDSQEESGKYKIKTLSKGERDYDRFGEDRTYKFKDTSYLVDRLGVNKGKYAEEGKSAEKFDEKITIERDTVSPQQLRAEKLRELYEHGGLLQKTVDVRDKALLRDESLPRVKMVTNESCRPEVKVVYDDPSPGTSVASDRSLASALVHSVKREQGFRSIFDHIKGPQEYKSSAESFIQHIVSLVHHVTEHYFKSTGMTLHERFTVHQKAAEGHEARPKSPEIHRRINISPSVFKKERIIKEEGHKGEKKSRCDSADLRHDIDRRRKERSRERDDSRGSREPSPSRKLDKLGKEFKDYKDYKSYKDESKHKSKERDRSRSSSSSSVSQEDKDSRKERDEEYKSHHEQKDYAGYQGGNRARGTFQFRIRGGRGRGRGVFSGQNAAPSIPNVPFQKRPKEEEWDPEYTPKSKKYFLHDDRDDGIDYWAKRGRGRGTFQRGRGRFIFKKSSSSPKWTHDKYRCEGNVEEDEEEVENEQRKDKHKDEKVESVMGQNRNVM